jgi:membrane-associated phospholipid phosphatase
VSNRSLNITLIVLFLVLSACAIWAAFHYDEQVRVALVELQGKRWKKSVDYQFVSAVRVYGDWPFLMAAGAVGMFIAWLMRNREWQRILAAAMIASTMAGFVANTSRLTTGHTRPRESPKIAAGFYGPWHDGKLTIGNSAYNSFPSGHTATAFAFAAVICFASPWLGVGAVMIAGLIAWSSVAIGAHYLSDVTVSIVLAFIIAWFVWRWMEREGENSWRKLKIGVRRKWAERRRKTAASD